MPDSTTTRRPEGLLFVHALNVARFHDDEGRPVLENKVFQPLKAGVPMELSQCPYPGTRHKHAKPMNVSALRQSVKHWAEVLSAFNFLRGLYVPGKRAGEVTLLDFWRIAQSGSIVFPYLVHRAEDPLDDGAVPAVVAAVYKASLGLYVCAQRLITFGPVAGHFGKDTIVDADAILAFAEEQDLLVGKKEVCAGPPNMIKEVIRAIAAGHPEESELSRLIRRPGEFFRFAAQAQKLDLIDFLFPLLTYFSVAELFRMRRAQAARLPDEVSLELAKLEEQYPTDLLDSLDEGTREHYLAHVSGLFLSVEENPRTVGHIREASHLDARELERAADALLRFITAECAGAARSVGGEGLGTLARCLAAYLLVERKRLQLYREIQSEMNAALGRGTDAREPDGSDVTRAYGKTVRDVLADFLCVRIENRWDRAVVRRGESEITI